jgi:hypothetical protein
MNIKLNKNIYKKIYNIINNKTNCNDFISQKGKEINNNR